MWPQFLFCWDKQLSTHIFSLWSTLPKAMVPTNHRLKTLQPWANIALSLFISDVMESWVSSHSFNNISTFIWKKVWESVLCIDGSGWSLDASMCPSMSQTVQPYELEYVRACPWLTGHKLWESNPNSTSWGFIVMPTSHTHLKKRQGKYKFLESTIALIFLVLLIDSIILSNVVDSSLPDRNSTQSCFLHNVW